VHDLIDKTQFWVLDMHIRLFLKKYFTSL